MAILKRGSMISKFVLLEIVFKVCRSKAMPVDHGFILPRLGDLLKGAAMCSGLDPIRCPDTNIPGVFACGDVQDYVYRKRSPPPAVAAWRR